MDAFGSTNKVRVLTLAEHTVRLIPQVTQVPRQANVPFVLFAEWH